MKKIPVIALIVLFAARSNAQTAAGLTGSWKGTSLCQVKNSPCHDEIVMYPISKTGSPDLFSIVMDKIVNNKEEEMGVLDFVYDPQHQTLTNIDTTRNARWVFNLEQNRVAGTLVYKNVLYRIIDLKKED